MKVLLLPMLGMIAILLSMPVMKYGVRGGMDAHRLIACMAGLLLLLGGIACVVATPFYFIWSLF